MYSAPALSSESDEGPATRPAPGAPEPSPQPDAVRFIDNNLCDLHNALRHPMSKYDSRSKRYIAVSQAARLASTAAAAPDLIQSSVLDGSSGAIILAAAPMTYWDGIFQKSVDRFKALWVNAPKDREKSGLDYGIRDRSTWEDVYSQLQKAREFYDGDTKGLWGRYAKGYTRKRRWFVDHSGPVARQAVKFVPQMDYATPVIAAVQVLVDAFETTSRARETMTSGLARDDLERKFSSIELFLATFPKDDAIEEASVELVAATLKAIEDAIGFFLESNVRKAFSATLRGKEYQKSPLGSLEQIRVRGDQLLQAAQRSHITNTQQKLDMVLNGTAASVVQQMETGTNVKDMTKKVASVLEKLDKREASDAFLRNTLVDLLNEAHEEKERELEEKRRLNDNMMHLEDNVLRLMEHVEELRRARTPSPGPGPQSLSSQAVPPAMSLSPLHVPGYMPTFLHPYMAQNMSFSQIFPLEPPAWDNAPFQGQQPRPSSPAQSQPGTLDIAQIRSLLQMSESVDILDISAILEDERRSIAFRERRKADLIVSTSQFRSWMVSNKSNELLVHGEFRGPRSSSAHVSALSVFCATLTQTLRDQDQQHIVLVFFCGSHVERDDQHRGAIGMIRSFAAQLVRSSWFDTVSQQSGQSQLDGQIDVETIVKSGTLLPLCQLFGGLVRLLPEQVTLICLVDGISHYETDEFEDEMLDALDFLLNLIRKNSTAAAIKLMASSPTVTDLVQHRFKDDDSSFMSLAEVRDLGQGLGLSQLKDTSDDDQDSSAWDESEVSDEEI